MVDPEELESWVEKKLENGVDPERIKQSLRETGHDPSIVDEVQDPFDGKEEEQAPTGDTSNEEMKQEPGSPGGNSGSIEKTSADPVEGGGGSFSGRTSLPGLSVRALLLAVIIVAGAAGYFFLPWSSMGVPSVPAGIDLAQLDGSGDGVPAAATEGCPDVGVRIESVSTSRGQTTAEVRVTRGTAYVTLDVYSDGSEVGSDTKKIGGRGSITVDATGDEAVFHPYGCSRYKDSASIG